MQCVLAFPVAMFTRPAIRPLILFTYLRTKQMADCSPLVARHLSEHISGSWFSNLWCWIRLHVVLVSYQLLTMKCRWWDEVI